MYLNIVIFQVTYKQLSNRILPVKLYKKSLLIAIIIPILSTTSVIVTHVTMVHFKTSQIIPYVFLEILTYMLGGYWYLLCEILSLCANVLADDFQQVSINSIWDSADIPKAIREYLVTLTKQHFNVLGPSPRRASRKSCKIPRPVAST